MSITVDEARSLMHEWVENPSLRTHMECVAACMEKYASAVEPDAADDWVIAGLLHDMDYERHPTVEEHPFICVEHLRQRGDVPESIIDAILGHADYSGVPRVSSMSRHLYACDELSGFIVACARVRPDGIGDLQPRSVKKKLKDKGFAAAVNRDDIRLGAEELELDLTNHVQTCIDAIREKREELGL